LSAELPIHAVRSQLEAALARGPVVLSSPTGSGKSTEVPRWCPGRTLVIEPRRIACRSLAARVAELEQTDLGRGVGYTVRDERVLRDDTRIVFATPGIALRDRALLRSAHTVILDEFHERSLEVDLLLALLCRERPPGLVIMSATLDAERVARHVDGVHLTAAGREFPVRICYLPGRGTLPSAEDLALRVQRAVASAADDPGDILVFVPGKAEIDACGDLLRGPATLIPLHGGLSLGEQRRAFEPSKRRKIILATNVAETSLTIPGIGVVIDAGLVRQTRYHEGRSYLALGPIAQDSAAQRAGRAGRTAPGVCYRLWSANAALSDTTPPEIHRESLVPLVLHAAAWGARVEDLQLLDPAKEYALTAARAQLGAWNALDAASGLSDAGRLLLELPLEPRHARFVVEARRLGCVEDMIDLLAVLSVGRPLFTRAPDDIGWDADLRAAGCDASAAIAALRAPQPADHGVATFVIQEARAMRARLRRLERLPEAAPAPAAIDRDALIEAILAADPKSAYVARTRAGYFSNGEAEVELARESAARRLRKVEALLALETRGLGAGRDAHVLATCAMPVQLSVLARAGLGEDRLSTVRHEKNRVLVQLDRVYGNQTLSTREDVPQGELARSALAELISRGSLFAGVIRETRERLARSSLAAQLQARKQPAQASVAPVTFDSWLRARIETLGVESGEDLALLSAKDFSVPEVAFELRAELDSDYPATVSVGDATYRAEYELERNQVVLHMIRGSRREPPPLGYLPKFPGLRVCLQTRSGPTLLRERGR
jgi:ATP-dependent helicase HrpB